MPMYTENTTGSLVWEFDQKRDIKGSGRGVCAGVSIYWILLRAQNEDFEVVPVGGTAEKCPHAKLDEDEVNHIKGYQAQNVTLSQQGTGDTERYQTLFGNKFDVSNAFISLEREVKQTYNIVDLNNIADEVARLSTEEASTQVTNGPKRTWFIVRGNEIEEVWGNAEPGGHAIVIEVSGAAGTAQVFRLMDPMNGCACFFDLPSFRQWLQQFLLASSFTTWYDRIEVHRLSRPAPNPLHTFALQASSWLRKLGI